MNLDFLSPQFPSDPPFWHSIWHWNPLLIGHPWSSSHAPLGDLGKAVDYRRDEVGFSIAKAEFRQAMFKIPRKKRIFGHDLS